MPCGGVFFALILCTILLLCAPMNGAMPHLHPAGEGHGGGCMPKFFRKFGGLLRDMRGKTKSGPSGGSATNEHAGAPQTSTSHVPTPHPRPNSPPPLEKRMTLEAAALRASWVEIA